MQRQSNPIYYKEGFKYQLTQDHIEEIGIVPSQPIKTEYIWLDEEGFLVVKKGYAWDGASGPTIDTKSSMRGSLVHDALYQLMRMGLLDEKIVRPKADALLKKLCIEDGMNYIRADFWKIAVNLFAESAAKAGTEREILIAPEEK